jgi:hypothetical protein
MLDADPRSSMTDFALHARADVVTDSPERYAKQLVAHLGRRLTWTHDGGRSTAGFERGEGGVITGDGVLVLTASAADVETLERIQDVLGRHLERFGQRNELVVAWSREQVGPTG